jgi:hypothetical protein
MREKIKIAIVVCALLLLGILPSRSSAQRAPAASLEDQLQAQYALVKMGADSSGPAVVEPGTILVIQKGGILGVPYSDVTIIPTKYQDGAIHSPNNLVMKGIGSMFKKVNLNKQSDTRLFQVGERVYPSRIEVNAAADKVTMGIIACDACNNVNPPTFYKSDLVFQFPKGTLASASPSQIEDTIAQVFTIDDGGNGQQNDGGQQNQGEGAQEPAQEAPQPPQTIQLGQSMEEVTAILGQPGKIVNLGAKQIYVYKDLKVTFVKAKVADVQ